MAESRKERAAQAKQREFLCEHLSFAGKEAYKRLRTNLQFSFPESDGGCSIVGITSSQPAEGKSLTSINLAFSLAQLDKKVLLIDADMRRSSIDTKLGIDVRPGLSNLLTDVNNSGGTIKNYEPEDESVGFSIIPAGDVPPNPSELLNSDRMARLVAKLRTMFDYIVIDLPPVGAVVDAQTVSRLVDGMLIVLREDHTSKYVLEDCVQQLKLTNTRILGFVVNGSVDGASKGSSYGKYGKYGYYSNSYNSYYTK